MLQNHRGLGYFPSKNARLVTCIIVLNKENFMICLCHIGTGLLVERFQRLVSGMPKDFVKTVCAN